MENITFVRLKKHLVLKYTLWCFVFGPIPSFGLSPVHTYNTDVAISATDLIPSQMADLWNPLSSAMAPEDCDGDGVSCEQEEKDGTDPNDPCDFILEHQNCTPSEAWKKDDCDGDGVSNGKEKEDGTDPLDPCDFVLEHQDCSISEAWKKDDCDGDGVSNGKEKEDGTDPLDPCDFILEHQDCSISEAWKKDDCDGDGVSNGKEKEDGTDPLDPCDFILEHQDCSISEAWKKDDCDGDGVSNGKEKEDGTDPLDPCDFVLEHQDCSPSEEWKKDDCDGDGVSNGKEKEDGTDPLDPCDFVLEHQDCSPSEEWKKADCDGDGVTNEDEKEDGTDPLDPCDYKPESVTLPQTGDYLDADCDGDGVTNEDEEEDGTDPLDPCSFLLESQTVAPDSTWNAADCDGDGVTNEDEKEDGTDPLDPCDYKPESVTLPQTGDYLDADCDGDGVTNEDEEEDGTDPLDPCSFLLESQTVAPDSTWNAADCDGDGVTNEDEKEDGTDPLDPCDYKPESVTLPQTADWEALDCDDDGNPNGPDPDPLAANASDDYGSTPALTEVAINILENDDYLPNNDGNNLGETNLSRTGGDAVGTVSFDNETGFVTYTPTVEESNSTVTIVYQVCNVLPDPSVCASATIYIEVGANAIDAVDDAYSVTTDQDGVIEGSDVLLNDTLNGEPISIDDVVLTSTATAELTVNPDGSISVTEGTVVGTYTIDYTICDAGNATNCDTATVTVTVTEGMGGNVIDAVDDTYTDEDIDDSDVLLNDTLNGQALTLADVILTSTATEELTINPDGSVTVAPGTEVGTYTIDYTICDIMDVDNCDTATVTVIVTTVPPPPPPDAIIDAVDDAYTATVGEEGMIMDSDVLMNDTYDNFAVTLADVILTSTPTEELRVNEDGSVSVLPGTPEGTYTITYTICDILDVDNCDTATVTVEVTQGEDNVIDAVDDTYNTAITGGLIANSNVLENDTLNGELVSLGEVELTSTPTNELSIEDNGTVRVADDASPGTYTIEYTICEVDNPDNCDTATVTVVIEAIEVNQMLTPNGDLKNDFLFIRGVEYIKSSKLRIFNRWGTLVFEGDNYNNVNNAFDGRVRGKSAISVNEYLPAGVYFYIFNYETEQGSFTDSEYIYLSR
ncbi:gliding motility-associated C-terminal domain-containing protein [Flagellimonas oceani]|uniref:Gliding motility-associated C-terminal domain-containing protein n=1 Tax=Flagellimonas oceani TaxID=2698672 RepID=A0A6G7IYY7_9FLAO|nr:gliding motility-associated C-terminal domain-containing protein [Allomuricauda oceani]QII43457.1 gliding motility-associated C-terminal domain-containing protein [Allomuricauda oceani]